jgi:hypothetical protein
MPKLPADLGITQAALERTHDQPKPLVKRLSTWTPTAGSKKV